MENIKYYTIFILYQINTEEKSMKNTRAKNRLIRLAYFFPLTIYLAMVRQDCNARCATTCRHTGPADPE